MDKTRFFSKQELEKMGKKTVDLICEAIDAEDKEKSKDLAFKMYREFQSMHDLYRNWITGTLSFIYENYGDEILYEALHQGCSSWYREFIEPYKKAKEFRHLVRLLAMALRGHLQPMKVVEDDDKVCITLEPCGSGERLFKEGGYGPPKNFSIVKKPLPITYGKPNCPIYCIHEAMFEILPIEWFGYPIWVVYPPEGIATGGCRFCIFKNPEDIPEEAYTRLGKKKPNL